MVIIFFSGFTPKRLKKWKNIWEVEKLNKQVFVKIMLRVFYTRLHRFIYTREILASLGASILLRTYGTS